MRTIVTCYPNYSHVYLHCNISPEAFTKIGI